MMNFCAFAMARARLPAGKSGSMGRNALSMSLNTGPQADLYGPRIQSLICAGGVRKSSSMRMLRGLRAQGFCAISTSSGVSTVRDQ